MRESGVGRQNQLDEHIENGLATTKITTIKDRFKV
jgi:hypothetical protein